jgi:hypothetical protein
MKRTIALFGLVGLVGCFLPLVGNISMFDFRHYEALQTYLILGAFAVPMVVGLSGDRLAAGTSLIAMVGFGYVLYRFGFDVFDVVLHASIGGKLMVVGAVGGFIASIAGLAGSRTAKA